MGDQVKVRKNHSVVLEKLLITVNSFGPTTSAAEIITSIEKADATWTKLEAAHLLILDATVEKDIPDQMKILEPMDKCYMEIKAKLYTLKSSVLCSTTSTAAAHPRGSFKLPDISAPSFDGKYEEWTTFEDAFNNAIHSNTSLSGAQKLQYLKSMVKGEAANLIKSFTVTNSNYVEAWSLLDERYNNKREIIQSHIKKLIFQQSLRQESVAGLEQLLNTTMESLRSLKALGRPTDKWDDIITVIIIEKLDPESKAEWARTLKNTNPPTVTEVQQFLEQHIRTLRARGIIKQSSSNVNHKSTNQSQPKTINNHHTSFNSSCPACSELHPIFLCTSFRQMNMDKKVSIVKSANLCWNCLKSGHSSQDCVSAFRCKTCNRKHNSLLHNDNQPPSKKAKTISANAHQQQSSSGSPQQSSPSGSSSQDEKINISTTVMKSSCTLLKTALVDVMSSDKVKHQLRVFIDDGAEGGLITESIMNRLGLRKHKANVTIAGVGGTTAMHSKWKTFVRLFSQVNDCFIDAELYAVPQLTSAINKIDSSNQSTWKHIQGLRLADPLLHQAGEVDILLGSNTAPYILTGELRKSSINQPVAQRTIFGWVLSGNTAAETPQQIIKTHHFTCQISEILKKFWEIEELPSSSSSLSKEEEDCEKHFQQTYQRQHSGRYMVRLPFNEFKQQIGSTREQALYRLHQLERRFKRHPEKKQEYVKFMREYENLHHMEKVSDHHRSSFHPVYLPHHFVMKEDSTTTKQRTVFDGSAKSNTGVSLNAALLTGATIQPDLFTLLLRFRLPKIALKADIAKMYRQFIVHPDDQDHQRILWREEESSPVQEYRLTTVTYGTACAPFLATRCLNQLAEDEASNYPAAAQSIRENMYVDDFIGGSETKEQAVKLVEEMRAIVASAGMEIRKWSSNQSSVLDHLPPELREESISQEIDDGDHGSIKALGIRWQPTTDSFGFKVNIQQSASTTKRTVLSEVAKTFDPLGWLSPVTIRAKLLLQQLWLDGFNWDDQITAELQQQWREYQTDLLIVEKVQVPRCVITSKIASLEIHGYSDSSELGYASAVYLKCVYKDGSVSVNLLTSKTKVAPLKAVSLPKLELCGAKLLAETVVLVQKSIKQNHHLFCWSDSTIALRWIKSLSRKWKTYVANRVSTIQSLVPPDHWHHVRSQDNPADLPSRGIPASQLVNNSFWWHGPAWLQNQNYPINQPEVNEEEVKKEERAKKVTCFHLSINATHEKIFNQYSSMQKLCRAAVYFIRYINYLNNKTVASDPISTQEIQNAKVQLIKWSQRASFPQDYHDLLKNQQVSSSSKLIQLNPYVDSKGILRVGGRIHNSQLSEGTKHPIILSSHHQLTKLIISQVHLRNLHSGFTLTMSTIRRDYWILRGRDVIRNTIRKCIVCRRNNAATATQLMGNLPRGRVTASRPFLHCGVDYAGPFSVKLRKGRHVPVEKAYFAIFVCLATKAVHLESVNNLTTDAFIACLERLIARRGVPAYLYSDCGTNFVGADKILQQFLEMEIATMQSEFANRGTQWVFNPPAAPHQGGLWEAGVKSVKFHFKRVVGSNVLMLDQFQTLLCKIEGCLNSRPLCSLSSDPTDLEVLTPGHFLIGGPINAIPEPNSRLVKENRLTYWELVRQKTQHFWDRWTSEYLTSLQQRFKWTHKRDNLQEGDLVIIKDEQMPPTKWRMGRIIATHPGQSDKLVRSVTLKTSTGELTRPITKLSPLISINESF